MGFVRCMTVCSLSASKPTRSGLAEFSFPTPRARNRNRPKWSPWVRDQSGKLTPIDIEVGDRILFDKWSGTEIKLDGIEYLIITESDVLAC